MSMDSLAQACIQNVGKAMHKSFCLRGLAYSHTEIDRLCYLIDNVADGLEKTFSDFNRQEFVEIVFGDRECRVNFEAGCWHYKPKWEVISGEV